ncbi:MAG: secretin and TonB N-terminal domain-containing protein [Deltaproteobacteria bacterium]
MRKCAICFIGAALLLCQAPRINAQETMFDNFKFKDADIRIVLQAIGETASKGGKKVNIVISPEVQGNVSIDLERVDWETALNVLLKPYNFGYRRYRNVIMVGPVAAIQAAENEDLTKQGAEFNAMKVFRLKYIDANDAKKAAEPLLSKSGKIAVLDTTGQGGWSFGMEQPMKLAEAKPKTFSRAKVLIVSDVPARLEQISNLLDEIDVMSKQILIRAKILEVNRNTLRDLGLEWGTGTAGASSTTIQPVNVDSGSSAIGAHSLAQVTPSAFAPQSTGLTTANSGLKLQYQHLSGTQFEVILHALEEKDKINTLSAPVVLTLNNQEASILIGTKFPIIKTDVSTATNYVVGGSLQEYKDIGIQLNVVPQIWGDNDQYINMIVHPAISSFSSTEKVVSQNGTILVEYPIISTREAETQMVVKDGETVMIGGLLKDVKENEVIGIPVLSKIPLIGGLFRRHTNNSQKMDLLIFITAQIIKPGDLLPQEIVNTGNVEQNFPKEKVR